MALRALPAVTPENAVDTMRGYDLVLDCTDNPASRYLLSDAACAARIPLVSGAAVGTEGQVTVLCGNDQDHAQRAPCYRCLFPRPAGPKHCARCADAGVLGPVPGVIGTLQAVEAIKVLTNTGRPLRGRLLSYDALSDRPFYGTTLPPAGDGCTACGSAPGALRLNPGAVAAFDYAGFVSGGAAACAAPAAAPLPTTQRISVRQYAAMQAACTPHVLVDVRPRHLFDAAALHGAISVPFSAGDDAVPFVQAVRSAGGGDGAHVVLICRRGNASVAAAAALRAAGATAVCDVEGGVMAWRREIDATFPEQ